MSLSSTRKEPARTITWPWGEVWNFGSEQEGRQARQEFWADYLSQRRGDYAFRCQRYDAVINVMLTNGFRPHDTVVDIGAGTQEFATRLAERTNWSSHYYIPIDAAIDGTDLETWVPSHTADWFIMIEVLEHLACPLRLLHELGAWARIGMIATTPNPAVVDVLAIDQTHQTPIPAADFHFYDFDTEIHSFFAKPDDTILAWRIL